jgi:hypothetical protein
VSVCLYHAQNLSSSFLAFFASSSSFSRFFSLSSSICSHCHSYFVKSERNKRDNQRIEKINVIVRKPNHSKKCISHSLHSYAIQSYSFRSPSLLFSSLPFLEVVISNCFLVIPTPLLNHAPFPSLSLPHIFSHLFPSLQRTSRWVCGACLE